jgi:hypothetical protein
MMNNVIRERSGAAVWNLQEAAGRRCGEKEQVGCRRAKCDYGQPNSVGGGVVNELIIKEGDYAPDDEQPRFKADEG